MLSKPVVFHPDAEDEAEAAVLWYRERSHAAAAGFIEALRHAQRQITANPRQWARYDDRHRRYVMRRFPFTIVFRETPDAIEVVAVVHAKRRPDYWRLRK